MFTITGKLDFHSVWAVAWVDNELIRYYRALIPKYYCVQPPKHPAHITVVSKYNVLDRTLPSWNKHQGRRVRITYDPTIRRFGLYFGLDAWSDDIIKIKRELGIPDYAPGHNCFHITIGNTKNECVN